MSIATQAKWRPAVTDIASLTGTVTGPLAAGSALLSRPSPSEPSSLAPQQSTLPSVLRTQELR